MATDEAGRGQLAAGSSPPEVRVGYIAPMRAEKISWQGAVGSGQPNAVALKDVRCGKCQKLLFRGELRGEIKCRGCGHMNRW